MAKPELPVELPTIDPPGVDAGNISITWSNSAELETATSLDGPWTPTGDQSGSFSEAIGGGEEYYRIRRAP